MRAIPSRRRTESSARTTARHLRPHDRSAAPRGSRRRAGRRGPPRGRPARSGRCRQPGRLAHAVVADLNHDLAVRPRHGHLRVRGIRVLRHVRERSATTKYAADSTGPGRRISGTGATSTGSGARLAMASMAGPSPRSVRVRGDAAGRARAARWWPRLAPRCSRRAARQPRRGRRRVSARQLVVERQRDQSLPRAVVEVALEPARASLVDDARTRGAQLLDTGAEGGGQGERSRARAPPSGCAEGRRGSRRGSPTSPGASRRKRSALTLPGPCARPRSALPATASINLGLIMGVTRRWRSAPAARQRRRPSTWPTRTNSTIADDLHCAEDLAVVRLSWTISRLSGHPHRSGSVISANSSVGRPSPTATK